jgi:hypothetical protein
MIRFSLLGVVAALLVLAGVIHATWTHRWERANDPAAITTALNRIPYTIDSWAGRDDKEALSVPDLEKIGPITIRDYVNRSGSNASVSLLVTAGRPGPLFVNHQPTDCYPAAGFTQVSGPQRHTVALKDGGTADFYVACFSKTRGPLEVYHRVYWSFSGAGDWRMPANPRVAFARYPSVYKMYVVQTILKPEEPLEKDPANSFIAVLVPELRKTLFAGG